MTKYDRRRRKSDEAIRDAFNSLLAEKDLNSITVKELAERADIDRKTFYLRYSSIDDMVDALLREEVAHMADMLATVVTDDDGAIDVRALFDQLSVELIEIFNQRAAVVRHVNTDVLIARLRPAMADVFAENDALGLAAHLGPYFELFVSFFCSGLLSLFHEWVERDSELPMEELAILAGSAVAGGIAAVTEQAKTLKVTG